MAEQTSPLDTLLRQYILHYVAVDIRQSEAAALVAVGELFVIDAKQVHHGCLKIVYMDRVLGYIPGEVIRSAIADTRFNSPSRHPKTEGSSVMIASVFRFVFDVALSKNRASEFASPND